MRRPHQGAGNPAKQSQFRPAKAAEIERAKQTQFPRADRAKPTQFPAGPRGTRGKCTKQSQFGLGKARSHRTKDAERTQFTRPRRGRWGESCETKPIARAGPQASTSWKRSYGELNMPEVSTKQSQFPRRRPWAGAPDATADRTLAQAARGLQACLPLPSWLYSAVS